MCFWFPAWEMHFARKQWGTQFFFLPYHCQENCYLCTLFILHNKLPTCCLHSTSGYSISVWTPAKVMSEARELSRCLSLHLGCVRIHKMHFPLCLIDAPVCLDSLRTAKLPHCLLKSLTLSLVFFRTNLKRIYKPLAKPEHGTFDIPHSSEWFMHVSFPCYSGRLCPFLLKVSI